MLLQPACRTKFVCCRQVGLPLQPPRACILRHMRLKQGAQLMLTTGSTRLAVSRGQQT